MFTVAALPKHEIITSPEALKAHLIALLGQAQVSVNSNIYYKLELGQLSWLHIEMNQNKVQIYYTDKDGRAMTKPIKEVIAAFAAENNLNVDVKDVHTVRLFDKFHNSKSGVVTDLAENHNLPYRVEELTRLINEDAWSQITFQPAQTPTLARSKDFAIGSNRFFAEKASATSETPVTEETSAPKIK